MNITSRNWRIILFVLSLFIRGLYISTIPPSYIDATDPREYDSLAISIIKGEGLKGESFLGGVARSYRPPLYPLFLALIYRIFGHSPLAVRIVQSILSSLLTVLIFSFTEKMVNKRAAILAGLGSCFYPEFVYYSGTLRPTILHTFLLFVSLYLIFSRKVRDYLWGGVFFALATLTRAITFYFAFTLPLWVTLSWGGKEFRKSFLFLLSFFTIMSIWAGRNYRINRDFLFTSYEAGYSLWLGHNPLTLKRERGEIELPHCYFPEDKIYLSLSEKEKNRYFKRKAFKYMKEKPGEFLLSLLIQLKNFYRPFPHPRYISRIYVIVGGVFTIPLFAFALYGIFLSRKEAKKYLLLYSLIAYYTLLSILFPVVIRYRIPIIPYFIFFASVGMVNLFYKLQIGHPETKFCRTTSRKVFLKKEEKN